MAGTGGAGGNGGGGAGGLIANPGTAGTAGTVNTGAGGGGGGFLNVSPFTSRGGGAGGSGVIILRYRSVYTATFSGGVTQTTSTIGSEKISIVTAAGVADTVSWA